MAEINYIRFLANKKDHSYADISRQVKRDPRTVKKYVEKEIWSPKKRPKEQRKAPVMDPVKPLIDK